jgi:putative PIN family toxin of toxin-antitoxin system
MIDVVLDTNVLVAAFRSRTGASFRIVELALQGTIKLHCSIPLFLEYEEILARRTSLPEQARTEFLAALLQVVQQHPIYFLFRGVLPDDDDAMI